MGQITASLDSKCAIVIPSKIRKALGIGSGSLVLLDVVDGSLVLRPAVAVPVERYTAERKAEFMLNNAVDGAEYERAVMSVRGMGLDPSRIPHDRPEGFSEDGSRVR